MGKEIFNYYNMCFLFYLFFFSVIFHNWTYNVNVPNAEKYNIKIEDASDTNK